MRDTEQLKRLPSEAFSFDTNALTSDRMLYVGLLSYDRSQLLSPHAILPSLFKVELNPDEKAGIEKRAHHAVGHILGTQALTSIATLHIPEHPTARGYLLGAASPRVSPEELASIEAFSHHDIRTTLDVLRAAGLENTPERQFLSMLGQAGCRYITHEASPAHRQNS